MNKLFLLQGIIFQRGYMLGTAYKPNVGIAATVQKSMNYAVFQGVVGPGETNPHVYTGQMTDRWGESDITEFILNENRLSFKKTYKGRPTISYSFREQKESVWHGTWIGPDCGSGKVKIIVIETDESLFSLPED